MESQNLVVLLEKVWTAFPADVYAGLQKTYIAGHRVVELVLQSDPDIPYMRYYTKYFFDFNDMKQYNAYTSKTRKIKFIPHGQACAQMKGKLARMKDIPAIPNKEKYSCESKTEPVPVETLEEKRAAECTQILMYLNRTWLAYPPDVLKTLQQSYISGHEIVEFVMLSDPNIPQMKFYTKYKIDFGELVQMNSYTEKSRKIKLVSQEDLDKTGNDFIEAKGLLAKDVTAIKTIECDNAGKVEISATPTNAVEVNSSGAVPVPTHKGKGRASGVPHEKYERVKGGKGEGPRASGNVRASYGRDSELGTLAGAAAETRSSEPNMPAVPEASPLPVGSPARQKRKISSPLPASNKSGKGMRPRSNNPVRSSKGKGKGQAGLAGRGKQPNAKKKVKSITVVVN